MDVWFGTIPDISSKLGLGMFLMENAGSANNIHYGSTKFKRVDLSVLGAELLTMAHGFDVTTTIRPYINDITVVGIPTVLYTDFRSLYESLVSLNSAEEKML